MKGVYVYSILYIFIDCSKQRTVHSQKTSDFMAVLKDIRQWKNETEKRPPYSYIALIAMSILNQKDTKETLNGIYKYESTNAA